MIQSFGRRLRGASLLLAVSLGLCAWPGLSLAATPAPVKGLPDFTELVEHVGPSVVNIRTLEKKVSLPSTRLSLILRLVREFRFARAMILR
jgi:serine protease Do